MKTHLGPASRDFDGPEFALIIALAFGLSIVGSMSAALSYSGRPIEFGDAELARTLGYEIVISSVIASLAIRLLYHLYQGPLAVMPIALFGLAATGVFVGMGRLWPVIVMHAIVDFVGLAAS